MRACTLTHACTHRVHLQCALWIPELRFTTPEYLEGISSTAKIPKDRRLLICQVTCSDGFSRAGLDSSWAEKELAKEAGRRHSSGPWKASAWPQANSTITRIGEFGCKFIDDRIMIHRRRKKFTPNISRFVGKNIGPISAASAACTRFEGGG